MTGFKLSTKVLKMAYSNGLFAISLNAFDYYTLIICVFGEGLYPTITKIKTID